MTPKELADLVPTPQFMAEVEVYKELTPIAHEWSKQHNTWGERFFSEVFFNGGRIPEKNLDLEDVSEQDIKRVLAWLRVGMGSMYPPHEDKQAVCGMLWQTFFIEPTEDL
jgi:hypothetical protein